MGGRLRQTTDLETDTIHPMVLDPKHHITQLLIKDYDHVSCILALRECLQRFAVPILTAAPTGQTSCQNTSGHVLNTENLQKVYPKMAELPPSRLRLWKPRFWSTGVDCFGPLNIKIGHRVKKRWGLLFKCMTTRCTHIELLNSLDSDSFLMSICKAFYCSKRMPI